MAEQTWVVKDNKVIHKLDKNHELSIIREEDGIRIKVNYLSERSRLIFSKFISDLQLGHIYGKRK